MGQVVLERPTHLAFGRGGGDFSGEAPSAVECALVDVLFGLGRVCVNPIFAVLLGLLTCLLGLAQSVIEHALVVGNEVHLALELSVEVILALREIIPLLNLSGSMASVSLSETVVFLIVHSQVVVEGSLAVSRSVH